MILSSGLCTNAPLRSRHVSSVKNSFFPLSCDFSHTLLDASVGIYNGGPGGAPQFHYNSLILGQNPVALEYYSSQIIDEERKKHGLQPVADVGRPTKYIQTAAELELGAMDPAEMQVIQLNVQDVDTKGRKPTTWGKIKMDASE